MSSTFSKLVSKLIAILVIVMFIVGFKEMILTNEDVSTAFGALMGTLPFADSIVDVITKVMKYKHEIPIISTSSVVTDLLRLEVMACIEPFIVAIISMIFLKVPKGDYYEREQYMDGMGYRAKEMIVMILTAPLIALAASYISAGIYNAITARFSTIGSVVWGIVTFVIIFILSLIPLLSIGVAIGTAITWRLLVSLLSKMVTTFMTNSICLWIYAAFLGGLRNQMIASIITMVIWLFIMDFGLQCLQKAIVS